MGPGIHYQTTGATQLGGIQGPRIHHKIETPNKGHTWGNEAPGGHYKIDTQQGPHS